MVSFSFELTSGRAVEKLNTKKTFKKFLFPRHRAIQYVDSPEKTTHILESNTPYVGFVGTERSSTEQYAISHEDSVSLAFDQFIDGCFTSSTAAKKNIHRLVRSPKHPDEMKSLSLSDEKHGIR